MESNSSGAVANARGDSANSRSRSVLWLAICALVVGLALRLVGFSDPPFDSHHFRQTQTLYTIEYFHETGIDLLHPKTIYVGYPGTLVLEFPLFQAIAALFYRVLGAHLEIVRLLNILVGFGSAWLVYCIASRSLDRVTGIWAAVIYWLSPLNVLYQRSMLADPFAVFFSLLSFYLLAALLENGQRDVHSERRRWLVFLVATCLAAVLKALYLWPVVLLLGVQFVMRRFRLDSRLLLAGAAFAIAAGCFLAWNVHAAQVNGASPFTRGLRPTSLLGVSALLDPEFYWNQLIQRPRFWLGVLGALLYPIGLVAAWMERGDRARSRVLLAIILAPPSYLVAFATINHPHGYYQLSITPFLAVVSANGLRWLLGVWMLQGRIRLAQRMAVVAGVLLIAGAPLTYLVWSRLPHLNRTLLHVQTMCAGKWQPNRPAMLFLAESVNPIGGESPAYLYAAELWGIGMTVKNEAEARRYYDRFAPDFPGLELVVFYGFDRPGWLTNGSFALKVEDDQNRLYAFSLVSGQ